MQKVSFGFISAIISLTLIFTMIPMDVYGINNELNTAPNISVIGGELKGKNELLKYFNDLKRIRDNINTINISAEKAKENSQSIQQQIKSYSSELNSILNSLSKHKIIYKESPADVFIANQIEIIAYILNTALQQQLILLQTLLSDQPGSTELFFSEYLVSIYYYITVADQMIAYINNIYNIK